MEIIHINNVLTAQLQPAQKAIFLSPLEWKDTDKKMQKMKLAENGMNAQFVVFILELTLYVNEFSSWFGK